MCIRRQGITRVPQARSVHHHNGGEPPGFSRMRCFVACVVSCALVKIRQMCDRPKAPGITGVATPLFCADLFSRVRPFQHVPSHRTARTPATAAGPPRIVKTVVRPYRRRESYGVPPCPLVRPPHRTLQKNPAEVKHLPGSSCPMSCRCLSQDLRFCVFVRRAQAGRPAAPPPTCRTIPACKSNGARGGI